MRNEKKRGNNDRIETRKGQYVKIWGKKSYEWEY